MRPNERKPDELRPIRLDTDFLSAPLGAVLVHWGDTKVLCTAAKEDRLPPWLRYGNGPRQGWVTAEYSMLPGSTTPRGRREGTSGRIPGRSQEIQRLIARSLRQAVNLPELGERQILVDCDVLQADGGTRTAAITGAWVALQIALKRLEAQGVVPPTVHRAQIAAVSVGILDQQARVDLEYVEDSAADVDANFVLARDKGLVEVQGTGEKAPFTPSQLTKMVDLAQNAAQTLYALQDQAVRNALSKS